MLNADTGFLRCFPWTGPCSSRDVRFALLAFLILAGCSTGSVDARTESLESTPRLVYSQRVWAAPGGGDGAPRYLLAWEYEGERTSAGVGLVTHARQWQAGALFVNPANELWFEDARIATHVVDAPAVAPDGSRFAYVVVEEDASGTRAALHVSDGVRDEVWDRSRLTLGALQFAPDGSAVLAVGSTNGGVAGLHVVHPDGARCLTNCALRVGEAWEGYVAPPSSASALVFDEDYVSFDTPQGRVSQEWR